MSKKYLAPALAVVLASALGFGLCTNQSCFADDAAEPAEKEISKKSMGKIYEFKAKALDGKDIDFDKYKGHVMLIVNTASKCGFTPQYAGLEELYKKFSPKGLEVLGFPCNQFGEQEPGANEEIGAFCQKNYGVDFQIFDKIDVKGPNQHPIYKYLTNGDDIKWNFTKFLINKDGEIIQRYESKVKPEEIEADIQKLL